MVLGYTSDTLGADIFTPAINVQSVSWANLSFANWTAGGTIFMPVRDANVDHVLYVKLQGGQCL